MSKRIKIRDLGILAFLFAMCNNEDRECFNYFVDSKGVAYYKGKRVGRFKATMKGYDIDCEYRADLPVEYIKIEGVITV